MGKFCCLRKNIPAEYSDQYQSITWKHAGRIVIVFVYQYFIYAYYVRVVITQKLCALHRLHERKYNAYLIYIMHILLS